MNVVNNESQEAEIIASLYISLLEILTPRELLCQ